MDSSSNSELEPNEELNNFTKKLGLKVNIRSLTNKNRPAKVKEGKKIIDEDLKDDIQELKIKKNAEAEPSPKQRFLKTNNVKKEDKISNQEIDQENTDSSMKSYNQSSHFGIAKGGKDTYCEEQGPSKCNTNKFRNHRQGKLLGESDDESDKDEDAKNMQNERKRNQESKDTYCEEQGPSQSNTTKFRHHRQGKLLGESDDESDDDEDANNLQNERKRNQERFNALINKLRDPELEKQMEAHKPKSKAAKAKIAKTSAKKRKNDDSSFRFHGIIPAETRKSLRLQSKNPEYTHTVIDDLQETSQKTYFKRPKMNEYDDLEEVVFKPKRKSSRKQKVEEHVIIAVEDVTQEMLDNIALRVKVKVYSDNGTTCHQCRQKTMDQKTCCRNPNCTGIFGMFCGICIKNRYGEDAAEALLNPNWICPVCRGKCNCSMCRTKQGKRPTGILAPYAQQNGYESVDHYLTTLKGEGDRPDEDHIWRLKRDPEALLGFSDAGKKMHLQGCSEVWFCKLCAYNDCNKPDNLLGFSKDGNIAIMGGHRKELLFKAENNLFPNTH